MPASEARRIGLILHDFPAGGTERVAIRLANAWSAVGRDVTIFCGTTAGPAHREVADPVTLVVANPAIPRSSLSRLRLGQWLRAILADHPVDVMIAPGNFHLPVLFAAGRLPCVVAAKLSNPVVRHGLGAGLASLTRRLICRHVDRLVAMSPALANEAEAVFHRRCEILAEPILRVAVAIRPCPLGPPLILCAGRMVAQKQFSLALRTFAALPDATARLVMLGDGPERGALEREAITLGIAARTKFAGHVPDITPWLARANAFLLTSRYEGYPAVLVEALAAGVPVVTTPCSVALREIVATPDAGRIAAADPIALAAALGEVLARGDIDIASRRALLGRHNLDTAAAAWLAMLDQLVAEHIA